MVICIALYTLITDEFSFEDCTGSNDIFIYEFGRFLEKTLVT